MELKIILMMLLIATIQLLASLSSRSTGEPLDSAE
jgi:hypothetical protein